MNKGEIAVGLRLAYRKERSPDHPVHEVVVTNADVGSRRAEVRFVGRASQGPVTVRMDQLRCLWEERDRVLVEESQRWRLREDWRKRCNEVTAQAIGIVATCTSESNGAVAGWSAEATAVGILWSRADLTGSPLDGPLDYQDRAGIIHLSWSTSLTLARALCKANPLVVLRSVDQLELDRQNNPLPSGELWASYDRAAAASLKMVRVWCDMNSAKARLLSELQPLREQIAAIENALLSLESPPAPRQ